MKWYFRSGDPDADVAYDDCGPGKDWFNICGVFDNAYPSSDGVPNELSLAQNLFHTTVVYRTSSVLTGWRRFDSSIYVHMADLYCRYPAGLLCASDPNWKTFYGNYPRGIDIDLGILVPVPLHHITFSQNPAVAGRPVTGEVFLQRAKPIDTSVFLNSNSTNATVLDSTQILVNKRGGTFQILTSPGGNGSGETQTATIKAYYADKALQEQLVLKTYLPGSFMPPTTTITTDPTRWAQYVPIGKWAKDYQVRYAVTFVDSQGNETDRGPWTPWFAHLPYALPLLFNIPKDRSNRAAKRRVYRQFYDDVEDANPSGGVEFVGQLDDNTSTELQDEYAD